MPQMYVLSDIFYESVPKFVSFVSLERPTPKPYPNPKSHPDPKPYPNPKLCPNPELDPNPKPFPNPKQKMQSTLLLSQLLTKDTHLGTLS